MDYFIGRDVSLRTISICVMDAQGKVHLRKETVATPEAIHAVIRPYGGTILVGLEAGSTPNWLVRALRGFGANAICLEAHHTRKVLSAQLVKTDRNDAEGIAQICTPAGT